MSVPRPTERSVPLSPQLAAKWEALKTAVSAAAKPFTNRESFPLSPFYLHDTVGADSEMERALRGVPHQDVQGRFDLRSGAPVIVVTWRDQKSA